MANTRPTSARVSNTNSSEVHLKARVTGTASNSRVSSAPATKLKLSSTPAETTSITETVACFLLDQNAHHLKDDQEMQAELRKIIDDLRIFDDADECEQVIRKMAHENIILVSSASLGRQIVPRIHDLSQLRACYIYYHNPSVDEKWTSGYTKIRGVFAQRSDLIARLAQDHVVRIRIKNSGSISVVSGNTPSLESKTATSMWFQLFIEVLLRMHHKASTRQELIDVCKRYYHNNSMELAIINEFEQTYKTDKAIWWYTRECCLYRILNKALRIQDFDTLFALRFFLTDLSRQLKYEHERYLRQLPTHDVIRVYRGQAISLDELKLIQTNIGHFISMNSFLSASRQRQTALNFLSLVESSVEIDRILFEIDIDPREETKPFSNIDHLSYFKNEDEVLIMLGALFRIQSIHEDKEKAIWIAHITLASEDDFYLKETFAHMKSKIGDETNLHSIGKILTEMGEYKQAQKCYQRMIYEAQLDHGIGYGGLGWAEHWLDEYDRALMNLNKGLSLIIELPSDVSEEKGRLYSSIGLVYWRKKQYDQAIASLTKALHIQQTILPSEHPDLLATYNRLAITHTGMDQVEKALEYYSKCLTIRLATLPHDHPDIATSYNNIGWLYNERLGDPLRALDFFEKALVICRKILPPTHRDIVRTEENIRKVNGKMKEQSKA